MESEKAESKVAVVAKAVGHAFESFDFLQLNSLIFVRSVRHPFLDFFYQLTEISV